MASGPQNMVIITGNLADDPELRFTPNGIAVSNCRVAVNSRRRNKNTNEWEDNLDGFFTVNIWRDHAENVAESLRKGDRVTVIGKLESRSYEDKEGATRWVTEITADEVSPSTRWATAPPVKAKRQAPAQSGNGGGGGSSAPPWTPPPNDDVPF